jgi:hypothetical protein
MHGPESLPYRANRTLPTKPFGSTSKIIQPTNSRESCGVIVALAVQTSALILSAFNSELNTLNANIVVSVSQQVRGRTLWQNLRS